MAIEIEIRSFISKEKYDELLDFFKKEGEFLYEDYQETCYFDSEEDLRIQRNNFFSKIWLKKGKLHDECREEIEIKFHRNDFEKLEKLFLGLGFSIAVKWFRMRRAFRWQGVDIMLDYTKGYGFIIELEKQSDEQNKEAVLESLRKKMLLLGVPLTSKQEFDERYNYYKENWEKLIVDAT
ncbi:CYTH domain-containing protein [Candidatus Micrarchaeota archaeon]|nr:CYTH domain-containing protein [Candidatus Micrarchaeota archaeon]